MPETLQIHHASISPLTSAEAAAIWQWVAEVGPAPSGLPDDLKWLHATFDAGLVWGRLESDRWLTGQKVFDGDLVPDLCRVALWELRLFGPSAEVLIWPEGDDVGESAPLAGRVLADDPAAPPPSTGDAGTQLGELSSLTGPLDDHRLLFGDGLVDDERNGQGFSLIGDATGARQVVPLKLEKRHFDNGRSWPTALSIRQYLETEPSTNATRIAATRFVDLIRTNATESS